MARSTEPGMAAHQRVQPELPDPSQIERAGFQIDRAETGFML
jgi:hypothetical protein